MAAMYRQDLQRVWVVDCRKEVGYSGFVGLDFEGEIEGENRQVEVHLPESIIPELVAKLAALLVDGDKSQTVCIPNKEYKPMTMMLGDDDE